MRMAFELDENELRQFGNWKMRLSPIELDAFGEEHQFEFILYSMGLETTKKALKIDGESQKPQ